MSNSFARRERQFGEPFEPKVPDLCRHCGEMPDVMCLVVPASHSYTREDREKLVDVDACIAPLVKALNAGGCPTVACCCGHGKGMGNIALCDGRELLIFPDWKSTREAERMLRENGDFRELAALRRVRNVLPVDAVRNFKCSLGCVFVKLRAGGPPMLITDDEIRDALKAALESEARE